MTRVLSALVLLPVVVGAIWFLEPKYTMVLALATSVFAFAEYRRIAAALGAAVPMVVGATAVALTAAAMWTGDQISHEGSFNVIIYESRSGVPEVLLATLIVAGAIAVARGRPAPTALVDTAATAFAPVYLGLPLGALAAIRSESSGGGREALMLLLMVIVVSDSAQYYCGRAFGRRKLSPAISPKKTVEGAVGGVVFATAAMAAGGAFVFTTPVWLLAILGAAIALLGIVGDLFESLLKRSAGVKDSSKLIPGHGGVLDRIDSWLFAAPLYYMFVRYVA
jgi:phosphatidate cytidylyltransferase